MLPDSQPILPPIHSPPPIDIPALAPLHSPPGPDLPHHPSRPFRPAHSNVLARLQALFPSHPSSASPQPSQPSPLPPPPLPKPAPKFIKVRILTWNMHDSLPKGDCQELLGSVPPFVPTASPQEVLPTLPAFSTSPDHPHHFVIVAGQECPSASGIPMALGAGFKLNNKDNSRSRHSLLPDPDELPSRKSADIDLSLTVDKASEHHHHPPSSWSSILENWYSHPPPLVAPTDLGQHPQNESQRVGPYELLTKERMMGLYLAVFIHREARPFVRGMSKSAVTTGLIGGRVGNKGGVGVSVNLDGTTLLFINAHLAAHEGKVNHRLADLAKIKAELAVDDFLSPNDPRFMAEDITDRFDVSFIFGDLNFRLDLTRLHADWLISRKEYEQALEFDQLRKVMAIGDSFDGFNEAPIQFPPTFKYDVLRTLSRRSRHKSFKRIPATPTMVSSHEKTLSEVAEHEKEDSVMLDDHANHSSYQERDGEDDGEPDAISVASSAWMSVRSRRTVDQDDDDNDEDDDDNDDDQALGSGDVPQSPLASASASNLVHKMWSVTAAHKAKEKWISLFATNSPKPLSPGMRRSKWRQSWSSNKSPNPLRRDSHITSAEDNLPPSAPIDPADPRQPKAGRVKEFQAALLDAVHARPHKHLALSENNMDLEDEDKGVYDSSHKQRVPSWCDRILWKSTIMPELQHDSEDTESTRFIPLRAKMGQIFNALKPSSMRSRRDSTWSVNHQDPLQQATPMAGIGRDISVQPSFIETRASNSPRASSPMQPKPQSHRRLSQTRSMDSFQRSSGEGRISLTRVLSLEPSSMKSSTSTSPRVPLHHANTISPEVRILPIGKTTPAPVLPLSTPSSPVDLAEPAVTPPSSAPVFRWLLPFLYKDIAHQGGSLPSPPATTSSPPLPLLPKRGDVTCLMYDTLDDKGMRRLEGRSDHRPVIGSYALYI